MLSTRGLPLIAISMDFFESRPTQEIRSNGCISNRAALAMVFKLVEGAQKTWHRLEADRRAEAAGDSNVDRRAIADFF